MGSVNGDQRLFQRIACSYGRSVQNDAESCEKPVVAVIAGSLPLLDGEVYSVVTGA